ncbi:hypothetical protein [Sphingomonas sp. BK069]|uniref:hypothetical protein n=1 Tax=Sphingomonas sp. BK069 TaxID=2586979 RepID=UPI00160BD55C|nr:hypothetical protein [Sphingomonas sp. BK069]MBB3347357.1 hypothetical protein [Sphingomonas sp. BK069]
MAQHIQDFCEDEARKGNGHFAIAYALLELASQQQDLVRSLDRLGAGTNSAPGAVELIAKELKDGAERIAEALGDRE